MNERDTDTDDTDGHVLKGKVVSDGVETDDTDGNSIRGKGMVSDGVEADDTEGHYGRH